jgi:GH3 auxin-responsive promoter
VSIQPKGLLSTEGVVSFPLAAAGGSVAAVRSHFLELLPDDSDVAVGVSEAEAGRVYEVLLTTSGGLYRYRTKDLVRVEGWYKRAPVLGFVGRADAASDLAGEKLTPRLVEDTLTSALREAGMRVEFAMLAPVWQTNDTPHYALFAECGSQDVVVLARAMESKLCMAHHYALCRELGQLAAVRGVAVEDGEATYERVCLTRGQRAGSVKPTVLDARFGWESHFIRRDPASAVA